VCRWFSHKQLESDVSEGCIAVDATDQVFRQEGDYWTVLFDRKVVRLHDSRGLRYLAVLLRHPRQHIPARAIVAAADGHPLDAHPRPRRGAGGGRDKSRDTERARLRVTKGIKTVLARLADAHPTCAAHLGATIRRGYVCSYTPDPRHRGVWKE
jgi:hypothetical protein